VLQLVGSGEYCHPAIIKPVSTVLKDSLVVVRPGQTYPPWETRRTAAQGDDSDGQRRPALRTTGIYYTTTILGAHTGTKTVSPLTLQVTGLIGSLHGTSLSAGYTLGSRQAGAKGRKGYSSEGLNVNIYTTQSFGNRVWITLFDRYRLPLLRSRLNKKIQGEITGGSIALATVSGSS